MFENIKLIQFFLTIPSTSIATERSYSTKLNNNLVMPIDKQIFIYKKKIIWKDRGIYYKTRLEIHVKINWLVIIKMYVLKCKEINFVFCNSLYDNKYKLNLLL